MPFKAPLNRFATILMYHYVRDSWNSNYPQIKALETSHFEGQLDYVTKHYRVCTLKQIVAAARGEYDLPPNACALTFDDGLIDHFKTVYPILIRRGISAAFFPAAAPILERQLLDVHKIHFLLASSTDCTRLCAELLGSLVDYRSTVDISPDHALLNSFAKATRYDSAEVAFLKRMLQRELPQPLRSELVRVLFDRFVTSDEAAFADELYVRCEDLREMADGGMEIGGHGNTHVWLGRQPFEIQAEEIARTVDLLATIFRKEPINWVMSYPYGSYNAETISLVSTAGGAAGLTTSVGLADLTQPFELARLDTNDLPRSINCEPCSWTAMNADLRL